jgi:hypothetical protein
VSPIARLIDRTYQPKLLGVLREWVEVHQAADATELLAAIERRSRELREAN